VMMAAVVFVAPAFAVSVWDDVSPPHAAKDKAIKEGTKRCLSFMSELSIFKG